MVGVIAAAAVTAVLLFIILPALDAERIEHEAAACDQGLATSWEKVDCWLRIVRHVLENDGIADALMVFGNLYDAYPEFAVSGCHRHAHQVGDMAYYGIYRPDPDLSRIDFPQSATACGYGFFHGFIEHLIQDNPDPAFVTETCEYLRDRYSSSMRDIATICYHGSGHGFLLAQIDVVPRREWGNLHSFIDAPMSACDELPQANPPEKQDCREGLFNVIADWMNGYEYGFSFDAEDPLRPCYGLPDREIEACYYEIGQRLEPFFKNDPRLAARYVGSIDEEDLRLMTFGVMIAGIMQTETARGGAGEVLVRCMEVGDRALVDTCIRSMVGGMMEHGSPGKEYERVLTLCAEPLIAARLAGDACYQSLARRLMRFYDRENSHRICNDFPPAYRDSCVRELESIPTKEGRT